MKICGQTYVELDTTLENIEEILEYLKENLWTFRRKIGTFKRLKIDAGLEHIEEKSLINQFNICICIPRRRRANMGCFVGPSSQIPW